MTEEKPWNSDTPPFSEYVLSSNKHETISLVREEQIASLLGKRSHSLKPVMVLSIPTAWGPAETPLYDWRDVKALACELGVDIRCVPANTKY